MGMVDPGLLHCNAALQIIIQDEVDAADPDG